MQLAADLKRMATTVLPAPIGVGVDVIDISNFDRLPFESHQRFYERCFSPREIAYCRGRARPAQHFAARFAAKEAAVKALSGHIRLAYWQAEVERAEDGTPTLTIWNDDRSAALAEFNELEALVTLSHSETVAAALVAVYRKDNHGG